MWLLIDYKCIKIGAASIAALVFMILILPINAILLNLMRKFTEKQLHFTDIRTKQCTELLEGIKVKNITYLSKL